MSEAITVALISGAVSLVGTIITVIMTSQKTNEQLKISQAITDTRIDELTREVRLHNDFAQRVPLTEQEIKHIHEQIDELKSSIKC